MVVTCLVKISSKFIVRSALGTGWHLALRMGALFLLVSRSLQASIESISHEYGDQQALPKAYILICRQYIISIEFQCIYMYIPRGSMIWIQNKSMAFHFTCKCYLFTVSYKKWTNAWILGTFPLILVSQDLREQRRAAREFSHFLPKITPDSWP